MYSIIGSGFGLYGYLPAIIKIHKKGVVLPEKYKEKILLRPELKEFEKDITWVKDRDEALMRTTDLIIAVPPNIQYSIVKKIVKKTNIKTVYLEKPIAPTVEMSNELLKLLDLSKVNYVIGYSFLYLDLHDKFNSLTGESQEIYWNWTFMAHHFLMNLNNWKRYHDVGGGVLRFYGIHVIAFLSMCGYRDVKTSTLIEHQATEPHIWQASISGEKLPICHVKIDCKSNQQMFNISNEKFDNIVSLEDPFNLVVEDLGFLDRRVAVLIKTLNTELDTKYKLKQMYANINKLWGKVEKFSKVIHVD